MEKTCTKCNKKLLANKDNFNALKNGKYGLRSLCKPCVKAYRKVYTSTAEYKKKHMEYMTKYRRENPEKTKEISRKNYRLNGEKHNAKKRLRYKTDPEFRQKSIDRGKIYSESGRRLDLAQRPESKEYSRLKSKKRRENKELRDHDYKRNEEYRKKNKETLHKMHVSNREKLIPSYVAASMRVSVKDLSPEVYETKKLIIQLKRELRNNNVKIR